MSDDIQRRVVKAIAEVLDRNASEIRTDAALREDLECDSLKQMTLFMLLEDEFERTLPPEDLTGIITVQDIIDFIHRKLQEPAST
jgi:acyl carrier protein